MADKLCFRSVEARRRYLAVYDRVRALSPRTDAVHNVPTEFGVVRVYQHGPDGGIPMVLLHCFWATSAMWAEHVSPLTDDFTVFTVDLLGQPGASVQSRPMKSAQDCACCLDQVLGGLGLAGVHLVGHSYGGWAAAQTAARIPDRLGSVTLIEPVNTVARLSARFWRTGAVLLLPGAERKQRTVAEILGHPAPGSPLDSVMELVMAAGSGFASFGTPFPRYMPDSLLHSPVYA
ncbi:alpha/beta fold hydrolase [Mycobacterium sp. TJFP1]